MNAFIDFFSSIISRMDILSSILLILLTMPAAEYFAAISASPLNNDTSASNSRFLQPLFSSLFQSLLALVLSILSLVGLLAAIFNIFLQNMNVGLFSAIRPFFLFGSLICVLFLFCVGKKDSKLICLFFCAIIFFACSYIHRPNLSLGLYPFLWSIMGEISMLMALLLFLETIKNLFASSTDVCEL